MNLFRFGALLLILIGSISKANADVTILLEEPYSYDGALAGTGHTAVYLSRVCAASPTVLRRCLPGEHGAVVSRYTRIAGYDWIAIPLVPYLYAVENPEDVPLYADAKLVAFLRDRYRRSHLEDLAPDTPSGEAPEGDWAQLIGSSYDRTSYGFQIETTPEQDDAFIEWLNSRPNRATYNFVSRNCANFVREVVNFYYPNAVSHGSITDLEVSTPKHDARSLVIYSRHHPDLKFSRLVFPQVPGTMKRSKPVHGVLESLFRAKKYVLPLAAFHPFIAGGVVSVYLIGDRFNPARNTLVFHVNGLPAAPATKDERRTYLRNLKAVMTAEDRERNLERSATSWREFEDRAELQLDETGRIRWHGIFGKDEVDIGISRYDLLLKGVPAELSRELIVARLRQELIAGRAPKISSNDVKSDWKLLQKINSVEREEASKRLDRATQKPDGILASHLPLPRTM
jgi:hypothetical protein